jgi:hypothetical protein
MSAPPSYGCSWKAEPARDSDQTRQPPIGRVFETKRSSSQIRPLGIGQENALAIALTVEPLVSFRSLCQFPALGKERVDINAAV